MISRSKESNAARFCWAAIVLCATVLSGCRARSSPRIEKPAYPFEEIAAQSGLNFQHFNGASGKYYLPEIMGSGVALLDYDGDGDLDVLLLQGDFLDATDRPKDAIWPPAGGWTPGCRLFRNDFVPSGRLKFTDVTASSGIHCEGMMMGAAVGDYDNDGWPDVYITGYGHTALFHNNGNGTFSDVTATAGVQVGGWSTSATFFDYDRDGKLDLFVTRYVNDGGHEPKQCKSFERVDYCGPQKFPGSSSMLFHNEGNGRFTDVTLKSRIGSVPGPGLGVIARDMNGDGWPDLYVANDGAASHLWINRHDGTFRESGLEAGIALSMDGKPQAGMGIAFGDFDNDGVDDIFKTNLTTEGGNLYSPGSGGVFMEHTASLGLLAPTVTHTGFGVGWLDYDNDGWLDLFIANGAVFGIEGQLGTSLPYRQRSQLFHNERGQKFHEVTAESGPAFSHLEVSRAAAFGDLDNDGRMDVVVTNNNGPVRLYHNTGSRSMHWLEVQLTGTQSNRFGFGAIVTVLRRNAPALRRHVQSDGSYLAAGDFRAHFGLGENGQIEAIRVEWPDARREEWRDIKSDGLVVLKEGTGTPAADARPSGS